MSEIDALFRHWQEHYAALGRKALAVPTGGSDGIGVWGYIAACEELRQDFSTQESSRPTSSPPPAPAAPRPG